jgi:F-box-like
MDKILPKLPNDMLDEIFSRLYSRKDYLHSIAVCRRWRSIGYDLKFNPRSELLFTHPFAKEM